MNYTQAYKTLVAYGCSPGEARDILEKAEVMPVRVWLNGGWSVVNSGQKTGFRIIMEVS